MKRTGVTLTRRVKDEATNEVDDVHVGSDDYRYAFPLPADYELMYNNVSQNPGWK